MAIEIRPATLVERPALERLIEASVRRLSIGYYTPQQIESALVHIFGVDTQLIADRTYFVAVAEGQIVGCGGWSQRKTLFGGDQMKDEMGEDGLLDPATDAARIRAFFVHPDWARRGIGRQIIAACEEAARRAGFTRMEMAATLPGVPLYAACGYEAVEPIAAAMPDGETLPILRMAKVI